jgi:hypothetical protein
LGQHAEDLALQQKDAEHASIGKDTSKLFREVSVEQTRREAVPPLLHGVGDVNDSLAGQGLAQPAEYLDGHRAR